MSRIFVFFVFSALFIDLLTDKVQPLSKVSRFVLLFFCFFVFLALFIDLLTDKVRFLSSSGSGGQCLGSNGPSDHCRMQPHFDCAWSRKKQWW